MIHARRSVCACGHAFTLKREARITSSSPVKRKRVLESMEDTLRRQENNRTRMACIRLRGSETQEQTLERLEQNRTRMASMRATLTSHVKLHKKRKNREAMANARTMYKDCACRRCHWGSRPYIARVLETPEV